MDLQLKEKVIIVTGGASGIGAAIVRAIACEGGIPVIVDRDIGAAQKLHEELSATGAASAVVVCDLWVAEECFRSVETIASEFGRIDGLVNNAGCNDKVGLASGNPAAFTTSLTQNVVHYYSMAHYCLPYLKKSSGAMVNIGSKVAVTGQGGTSGYAAAKGAVMALTREWAAELLPHGIRVNAVLPAEVMTPLYRRWLDTFPDPEGRLNSIIAKIPLGKRMTTPDDIAATAVFLLSAAAGHTTGQHLFVDGGYVHLDRALT